MRHRRAAAVIGCHFLDRDTLCPTTRKRLDMFFHWVHHYGSPNAILAILTGEARYEADGPLLAELMREYLNGYGFRGTTRFATGGTGSFAEPRLVTTLLRKEFPHIHQLTVISSDWQLWVGYPFWKRAAADADLRVEFIALPTPARLRIRFLYAAYAILIRVALLTKLWPRVERFLYRKLYVGRERGFRFQGC